MQVDYFVQTRSMNTNGNFVKWPVGVEGREHAVNFRTEDEYIHLSMVAHFCYKDALKIHDLSRQAKFFRSKIVEYFTFPKKNISKPVSLHDFTKLEKATQFSIWLYQVVKLGKYHDTRLLRKENNPLVNPERVIHLCQIEDTSHVNLIK